MWSRCLKVKIGIHVIAGVLTIANNRTLYGNNAEYKFFIFFLPCETGYAVLRLQTNISGVKCVCKQTVRGREERK